MYLYFYESKTIIGINYENLGLSINLIFYPLLLKECDDFGNTDDPDPSFSGWEKEENDDGSFYLVFSFPNEHNHPFCHTFYLGNINSRDGDERGAEISYCKEWAQKWVFDDEGTTLMYYFEPETMIEDKIKFHLTTVRDGKAFLYHIKQKNSSAFFSDKVCLTKTSNMNNSYVLK
jgi:hypothetical protein